MIAAPAVSFTVAEIASRYAVDTHSVLAWIRGGELKAINVGRSISKRRPTWRVTAAALEAFESCRQSSGVQTAPHGRRRKRSSEVLQFY
jgi:hypothetical protein